MARPKNNHVCAVDGCWERVYAKGWCKSHWRRMYDHGRLHKIIALVRGNCTINGCEKPIKGLGFCKNHYQQYRKYDITPVEYKAMMESDLICAICGEKETSLFHNKPGKIKNLAIDHCHKSGRIRELLCNRCNTVLGRVNEDIKLIQSMINYINKHKGDDNG